jgi:hypothetical protein
MSRGFLYFKTMESQDQKNDFGIPWSNFVSLNFKLGDRHLILSFDTPFGTTEYIVNDFLCKEHSNFDTTYKYKNWVTSYELIAASYVSLGQLWVAQFFVK